MTREPLHYWRRRRGMTRGAYVHNMRLKRLYYRPLTEPLLPRSPLFDRLIKDEPAVVYEGKAKPDLEDWAIGLNLLMLDAPWNRNKVKVVF